MEIAGIERFVAELEDFEEAFIETAWEIDKAVDRGVRKTAFDVERTAKRRLPKDTGELQSDLQAHQLRTMKWAVGSTKEYAPPMEYGSRRHPITPDTQPVLHFFWERMGTWMITKKVDHPGTPEHRFLRFSLNRHRSQLSRNIAEEIEKLIDRNF